jgi:hypothetical protein
LVSVRRDELRLVHNKEALLEERALFRDTVTNFVDVTEKLQQTVSKVRQLLIQRLVLVLGMVLARVPLYVDISGDGRIWLRAFF